jgi:hypothetical protein
VTKKIAVYGTYVAKVPVKQRYWKKRKDGIRQRYWKRTKRLKRVVMSGRYEFYGKGKDLYKAILIALNIVPKEFVDVSAEMFLRDPLSYGYEGKWIDRTVESG